VTRFELDQGVFDGLAPDQRRAALRAMAEMAGGHQDNPLWRFDPLDPSGSGVPHLPQHHFLSRWERDGRPVKYRLFVGGNRSGKTTGGDLANIIDCIDRDAVPPHLQAYKRWEPPINMYLVAVSQRAVEQIHLPVFRKWTPRGQLVGNSVDKALNKEYSVIHFKNGSTISFMTQNMDVDVFQGTALHRVHFDEEPTNDHGFDIYTECMQRLVDFNGDCLLTFTPLNGMTWVYDKLYYPWLQQQANPELGEGFADLDVGPIYLTTVSQDDNPVLDDDGKATALAAAKTDEERQARRFGKFVSFSGRIVGDFSLTRHVVPDDEVLKHLLGKPQVVLGGLDPGFRHMAGVLWGALDEDGLWVFPELALERTVISDVAREAQKMEASLGLPQVIFMADPAVAKIDAQTGKTDQQAYHEAGMLTRASNNDVRSGINAIRGLLATDRLHVGAGCEVLVEQFNRYRWSRVGRSEDAAPERPVKRDDHLLDALRYLVMALPIAEVAPAADGRSRLERLLAQDVAKARAGSDAPLSSSIGPGQFD